MRRHHSASMYNRNTDASANTPSTSVVDDADIAAGEAAAAAAAAAKASALLTVGNGGGGGGSSQTNTPSRRNGNLNVPPPMMAPSSGMSTGGSTNDYYISSAPTSMNSISKASSDLEFFEDLVNDPVLLLGVDISHLSRKWQFLVCASGVFWFSLLYGYLQELISVQLCNRKLGLFLAAAQFTGYTFLAYILREFVYEKEKPIQQHNNHSNNNIHNDDDSVIKSHHGANPRGRTSNGAGTNLKVPFLLYLGLSLLRAVDLAMTNLAMQYINYPAKTLMKSSRVVFTMLFGVVISRKRYGWKDYAIVVAMCLGLALFMHADATSSAVFHHMGVVMLIVSLVCDGAITNMSESIMKQFGVGQDEFIFRMYSIALVAITAAAAYKGDLREGLFWMTQPGTYDELSLPLEQRTWTVGGKVFCLAVFSSMGFFGSSCSAAITKNFGALTMSITSTARKAMTLFLSFFLFGNVCTAEHLSGIAIFIAALTAKSLRRRAGSKSKRKRAPLRAVQQLELQLAAANNSSSMRNTTNDDMMMPTKAMDEYEGLIRRTASHESGGGIGVSADHRNTIHVV